MPEELFTSHDLTVDIIVTPTRVIRVDNVRSKPNRIVWGLLTQSRLDQIPALQHIWNEAKGDGQDVTLAPLNQLEDGAEISGKTAHIRTKETGGGGQNQHGGNVSLFVRRIPKNARVKDLKDAVFKTCGRRPYYVVWKGAQGFAFLFFNGDHHHRSQENGGQVESVNGGTDLATMEADLLQRLKGRLELNGAILQVEPSHDNKKSHQHQQQSRQSGQQGVRRKRGPHGKAPDTDEVTAEGGDDVRTDFSLVTDTAQNGAEGPLSDSLVNGTTSADLENVMELDAQEKVATCMESMVLEEQKPTLLDDAKVPVQEPIISEVKVAPLTDDKIANKGKAFEKEDKIATLLDDKIAIKAENAEVLASEDQKTAVSEGKLGVEAEDAKAKKPAESEDEKASIVPKGDVGEPKESDATEDKKAVVVKDVEQAASAKIERPTVEKTEAKNGTETMAKENVTENGPSGKPSSTDAKLGEASKRADDGADESKDQDTNAAPGNEVKCNDETAEMASGDGSKTEDVSQGTEKVKKGKSSSPPKDKKGHKDKSFFSRLFSKS